MTWMAPFKGHGVCGSATWSHPHHSLLMDHPTNVSLFDTVSCMYSTWAPIRLPLSLSLSLSESRGEPTDHNWCIWGRTFPVRTLRDLGNCNNRMIKAIEKAMFLYVYSLSCSSKKRNKLQKDWKGKVCQFSSVNCDCIYISPFLSLPFLCFFPCRDDGNG